MPPLGRGLRHDVVVDRGRVAVAADDDRTDATRRVVAPPATTASVEVAAFALPPPTLAVVPVALLLDPRATEDHSPPAADA